MQTQVSSPGKLLILGEHIVLNGFPGLGIPLSLFLDARFDGTVSRVASSSRAASASRSSRASQLQICSDTSLPEDFCMYLEKTSKEQGLAIPQGTIHIRSDIPTGRGLGSSAALCSSLAKIILKHNKMVLSRKRVWHFAHMLEQYFHKPASGIDTAISAYARPLLVQTNKKETPLAPSSAPPLALAPSSAPFPAPALKIREIEQKRDIYLVLATLPRTRPSSEAIQHVQQEFQKNPLLLNSLQNHTEKAIENLLSQTHAQHAAHAPYEAHEKQRNKSLAVAIDSIHEILSDLGLCTKSMQRAIRAAKQAGAFSAKLSGAGFGGAFVSFCASEDDANKVQKVLQKNKEINFLVKTTFLSYKN